jgi:predicted RNase H-like nuclease (RuvC/YqgF family)
MLKSENVLLLSNLNDRKNPLQSPDKTQTNHLPSKDFVNNKSLESDINKLTLMLESSKKENAELASKLIVNESKISKIGGHEAECLGARKETELLNEELGKIKSLESELSELTRMLEASRVENADLTGKLREGEDLERSQGSQIVELEEVIAGLEFELSTVKEIFGSSDLNLFF